MALQEDQLNQLLRLVLMRQLLPQALLMPQALAAPMEQLPRPQPRELLRQGLEPAPGDHPYLRSGPAPSEPAD